MLGFGVHRHSNYSIAERNVLSNCEFLLYFYKFMFPYYEHVAHVADSARACARVGDFNIGKRLVSFFEMLH